VKQTILFIAILSALVLLSAAPVLAGSSTQGDTFALVCAAATRTTIYPAALGGDTKSLNIVKAIIAPGDSTVLVKLEDRWQNQYNGDTTSMYRTRLQIKLVTGVPYTWTPPENSKFSGLFLTTDITDTVGVTLYYK